MLSQVLQDNGFTEKEAKIYLAALELNNAPASSIARHASENRVTAYTILKDLCKKGIANEITRNRIKYYTVLSPNQLMELQESKAKKLKDSLPELLAITDK
jgi:sugar-specific transcriptional regulator TrmB